MKTTQSINSDRVRDLLKAELQNRINRNSQYSLRSFARSLGITHNFLSMILNGKRNVTAKTLNQFSVSLGLSPQEVAELMTSNEKSSKATLKEKRTKEQITLDAFSMISEPLYYGILGLLRTEGYESTTKWMAKRLDASEAQVKLAIERLIRLGYIEEKVDESGDKKWIRVISDIKIDNQVFSAACRKFQNAVIGNAQESLNNDPFEERVMESFTLISDPDYINEARKRIREVLADLTEEFEAKTPGKEVYNLSMQLYPMTKKQQEH